MITKVWDDMTFKAQMSWNIPGTLTDVRGIFLDDLSGEDEFEIIRWNFHEDYRNGDRGGVWVKWTEKRVITGPAAAMGSWYYGHIRSDGTLAGIHFLDAESPIPSASDSFVLNLVK
jgi:hypothetical protein